MRLVPGLEAGVPARRGRQFKALNVRQSPGKMELKWDPIRERGHVISEHVEGTGHLWIDASKIRKRNEAVLEPFEGELEPGMLAVDGAEDVILDLGMSKIVAMTAQRGWTSAEELERVMRQGLKAEEMDQSDTVELAPISELESKFDTEIIRENVVDSGPVNAESSEIVPTPQKDRMLRKAETTPLAQVIADPGSREVSSQMASDSHGLATHHQDGWGDRVPDAVFSRSLESLRDFMKTEQPHFFFDDVVVVFLALAVRPLVLISGPPGCGKSTLVRIVAQMLGKTTGKNFHEVAVQAHWESDGVLFDEGGLLQALLHEHSHSHLVLFDEFNLTRPEYYLSRLFHALESGTGSFGNASKIAPCRVLGTLNIDDSSRPPSPKVIDRGFLLELSQVSWNVEAPSGIMNIKGCEPLPGLPMPTVGGAETDGNLAAVLEALNLAVQDNDLRHDLLPSRRVLSDIKAMLSLHHRLDLQAKNLLDRDELVDRIIASRILVKLSGAIDQLLPALVALEKTIEEVQELPRSRRRLKLARQQARLGFISPWQ
jgi:energy-coupling factor transporter ATP-binding protein EcfA2